MISSLEVPTPSLANTNVSFSFIYSCHESMLHFFLLDLYMILHFVAKSRFCTYGLCCDYIISAYVTGIYLSYNPTCCCILYRTTLLIGFLHRLQLQ